MPILRTLLAAACAASLLFSVPAVGQPARGDNQAAPAPPAGAVTGPERITRFLSEIKVMPDASMQVTETITVEAHGFAIKHGIIRDFPTRYKDSQGNRVEVGFRLREVRRDGASEPYTLSQAANGVSIRIGSADSTLPAGQHTYTLAYRTTRQLGFFEGYDELYWNVTGNGWELPIDMAVTGWGADPCAQT